MGKLNIINEMKKEELKPPEFKESCNYFHIIFYRPQDLEEKLTKRTSGAIGDLNVAKNVPNNVAKNVGRNVDINAPKNDPNVPKNVPKQYRLEIILDKIKKNMKITKKLLAKELGVNEKTIFRDLETLKQQNKIAFTGSKKSRKWN